MSSFENVNGPHNRFLLPDPDVILETPENLTDPISSPSITEDNDFSPSDQVEKIKEHLASTTPESFTVVPRIDNDAFDKEMVDKVPNSFDLEDWENTRAVEEVTEGTENWEDVMGVEQEVDKKVPDKFDTENREENRANSTEKRPLLSSTVCDCPKIVISSQNPNTVEKHGSQLGPYKLQDVQDGRPVYKHESNNQYLYYHPYSGGNWLINSEVGLLYGGIQNSKVPLTPHKPKCNALKERKHLFPDNI